MYFNRPFVFFWLLFPLFLSIVDLEHDCAWILDLQITNYMNISNFVNFICASVSMYNNGTPLQYFCLENPMDGGAW